MVLILGLIIFAFSVQNENFVWLVLPFGLFLDFWRAKPLGYSGLEILALTVFFQIILGRYFGNRQKIRV